MERVNLPTLKGFNFKFDRDMIMPLSEEIEEFIIATPSLKRVKFTTQIPKDIQSNNIIEGIDDDIEAIRRIIGRKLIIDTNDNQDGKQKKVLNLYNAYRFILEKKDIDKETLRELYRLISDGLIDPRDQAKMGEYYRRDEVCISNLTYFDERITGVPYRIVDKYVDYLLEYIKTAKAENYTDNFIISQIVHFYLVFIHPYFDCNGRTSRTVAMWYLLNSKANAFLNFNRSIPFSKGTYNKSIHKSRTTSDLTHFVKYILETEKAQLEKDYIIASIEKSRGKDFTDDDYLLLEYFLSNKEVSSVLSLTTTFNRIGENRFRHLDIREKIQTFLDEGLIVSTGITSKKLNNGENNPILRLNREKFDIDPSKVSRLNLQNYINK